MKGGFEELPEGYIEHLRKNLRVATMPSSGKPGALKHDVRRFMHALHGVLPHRLTSHESYGPLKKHSSFAGGFFDELRKIAKINDPASTQRLDRGGWGPIGSSGIERGQMFSDAPLLPQREPSPVKPLEKKRPKPHP